MKKSIIETILFISGEGVSLDQISQAISESKEDTKKILDEMIEESKTDNKTFEIAKVKSGYIMTTKKDQTDVASVLFDKRQNPKLSNQAMEVLSIIAYNQDVTRAQIETIRGVTSDGIVHKLLEFGLIAESGRKETIGRPMGYRTTDKFLLTFGIENLKELPTLDEVSVDTNLELDV